MSKIKKILVVVAIFLIIMISALLATHAKGTSSWVGEYSGVEVTYSDTESGSYKKNQVTLCISEVAQGTQVELDIKELVGNDNGLDVTVLNRASNTVLISEKFIGKKIAFSIRAFPESEEEYFITLTRKAKTDYLLQYTMNGETQEVSVTQQN